MPSGPVAESELRFDSKLSTLSGEKDTEARDSWMRLGKVGRDSDGFLDTRFRCKHRVYAFSFFTCGISSAAI